MQTIFGFASIVKLIYDKLRRQQR